MSTKITGTILVSLLLLVGVSDARAQKAADLKLTAEIEKVIRDYYDAWSRADESAVMALQDTDGFYYSVRSGFESVETVKQHFRAHFKMPESERARFTYQIDDIKVVSAGTDTAIANYKIITKAAARDFSREFSEQYTNVFAKREGRWKLVAEHASDIPKTAKDFVTGMPAGWIRTPVGNAERYEMAVDNVVKHGGNASASLSFLCGETDGFGSLAQSISEEDYSGKRVRLSGWLKTENAESAGLWMRLDGVNRLLGFDNMQPRAVKGTTDWNQYSVVLDVPPETVNILFGTLLSGIGRVWVDDLKIDVVGTDVATTNQLSAEAMQTESPNRGSKRSLAKQPVNLGFENGKHP